jgi:hypothetical protein
MLTKSLFVPMKNVDLASNSSRRVQEGMGPQFSGPTIVESFEWSIPYSPDDDGDLMKLQTENLSTLGEHALSNG